MSRPLVSRVPGPGILRPIQRGIKFVGFEHEKPFETGLY
jgi:hypothetical protein